MMIATKFGFDLSPDFDSARNEGSPDLLAVANDVKDKKDCSVYLN